MSYAITGLMTYLDALWKFLLLSSPYFLFGMFLAGILHGLISREILQKLFGKNNISSIWKAALIGVPLPLCSCAVIPTAVTLKKNGAGNGATASFLITTPETGVDSIAITYSLIDLPMTIIRPVAAFITGITAGIFQHLFNNETTKKINSNCCDNHCCDDHGCNDHHSASSFHHTAFLSRVSNGIKFAFTELIDDMAIWIVIGFLTSALIDCLVPTNFFNELNPVSGRILIILICVPLYICASASTPIAASLMIKGLSPGMALLLLLVGPATNISNLIIMQKYIGKKGILINLLSIVAVALLLSYATDFMYSAFHWPIDIKASTVQHSYQHLSSEHNSGYNPILSTISSIFLIMILLKSLSLSLLHKLKRTKTN
ncbi:MAG: SO_0444 family Cu/Zn efflux transporter [Oligoflexia bacterium]|nr:SO_0444 family Cu/Zn efflux transporter [Oligoflexia bacterium]